MGFTAQSGQVIFATQTAPGVPVDPADLATDGISVRIRSGSLGGDREMIVAEPEVGGGRDTSDANIGAVKFAGDYEAYLRFEAIAFFLANALGTKATVQVSGATGAWEHTITPVDGQIPFMTVYEEISSGFERFIYSDVVVNTFHLEAGGVNDLVSMTAGLIGREVETNASPIDGTTLQDVTSTVAGTSVKIKYAGTDFALKSFSLDITNNFEDDNFVLGSFYLDDLTAKSREVSASGTVRHKDNRAFRQALFGSPTATDIGGITTKEPLQIVITSFENIVGATPATKYSLTLDLPKVMFEPFAIEVSGDDALENEVSMRAVRPDTAVDIITAKVVNGMQTIA